MADMFERNRQSIRTKDECSEGHLYTEHGRLYANGRKVCLVCKRDRELTWWYLKQGRERPASSMSRDARRKKAS